VSRAAFYRWRRQGAGPAVVRLPGGGVRVRRSARSRRGCAPWKTARKKDRSKEQMDSYDVRFWDIKKLGSGTGARFRVRWAVDGREHCRSFKARPLADGFLTELKDAVRDRRPFNPRTGLPDAETTEEEVITWFAHARAYTEVKWANLAPVSRRSVAEALVTVTVALATKEPGAPEPTVLRQALFAWAFNPATRDITPPPHIAAAPHRRRPRVGGTRLAPGHRPGRHRDRAAGAGRLRQDPGREAGGRADPAAQAVGVLQRARLRRRARAPRLEPGRPDPVHRPRRRGER
jgi:hypothetical protein